MSAQSDGLAMLSERVALAPSSSAVGTSNVLKRQSVSRRREVELLFPHGVNADAVIDAIVQVVNPVQLIEGVQMINSKKFLISFKTANFAEFFYQHSMSTLRIVFLAPICRWLGIERKVIRVSFLPFAVSNDELAAVLKEFGRVLNITDETYANRPISIKTGTRRVEIEMSKPVPNIITVCGFSVPVTYRGVVTQCRRCRLQGHMKAACTTPFCDRCRSFGHENNLCTAPCLKCKSPDHHWRDCTVRSYAFAAAATEFEAAAEDCAAMDDATANVQYEDRTLTMTAENDGNADRTLAKAAPRDASPESLEGVAPTEDQQDGRALPQPPPPLPVTAELNTS